jgi:D-alanyl-D-alanine carboxypeptidase (penicillin-binding protein 5/6)
LVSARFSGEPCRRRGKGKKKNKELFAMKNRKFKRRAGILAAAAVLLLGYGTFSYFQGRSQAVAANAAGPQPASSPAASPSPASSAPASSAPAERAPVFREQLDSPLVKNPAKLKSSLVSSNAILVSVSDQAVLLDKNASQRVYPASMTKIMTAVVILEEEKDLQEKLPVTAAIIDRMNAQDASMAGFLPGENVSALDLLYGAVLPSGAECCATLADRLAGSESAFAEKMNRKAASLGLKNTHFTNATGLHDPGHYTTPEDLASLLCYALRNPTFRRVFTTPSYTTAPTNLHPNGLSFRSTMFKNMADPDIGGGKVLGGKVGFTDQAGLCLASLAEKGGKEYVLVTAGAKNCYRGEIKDALTVYRSLGK